MSDCPQSASQEELSPSVSDEKMDTASESFPSSQHTPNTPSDPEDKGHFQNEQPQSTCQARLTNSYVNQQTENYTRNDSSFVSNIGVLRLANPPECSNDNESYRNSENYDLESVNTDTVSPLYEDTSSLHSPKGSSEFSDCPKRDSANNIRRDIENSDYRRNNSFKSENGSSKSLENRESKPEVTHAPLRLGLNPPRLTSTLTLTDDHPLMCLSSPESPPSTGNYPDLILQSRRNNREELRNGPRSLGNDASHFLNSDYSGMLSLSSTEDESFNRSMMNGEVCSLYAEGFSHHDGPQRNTSKNNLYFSENFTSSDGKSVEGNMSGEETRNFTTIVDGKLSVKSNIKMSSVQPDILDSGNRNKNLYSPKSDQSSPENMNYRIDSASRRLDVTERKKVKPDIKVPKVKSNTAKVNTDVATQRMVLGRTMPVSSSEGLIVSNGPRDGKVEPLDFSLCVDDSCTSVHDYVPEIAEFPKSPSELRNSLHFELPVEPLSNFPVSDDASPDSSSESRGDNERSLYCAEVDPYGGRVSLRPRVERPAPRRRIKPLISEADTESVTALNVESELPSLRRDSWSGSASSVDSLRGYSLHSDGEDAAEPAATHHSPETQHPDDNSSGDRSQETDGSPEKIPEYSLSEERTDSRRWLKVTLPQGERRTIDMKVIEPYKRVLSHGGYALSGRRDAIVVFSACFLPDSSRVDYNYVMDNLFLYVLSTMEQLVTEEYILIYLHGSAAKRSMPTFHWLTRCYQLVDRRLRKSLKHLYLVHPTFWLKSVMWMTRPFISSKFSRKLTYVYSLDELSSLVPVEHAAIPERVRRFDASCS